VRLFARYTTQATARAGERSPIRYVVPRSPGYYAARVTFLETAESAWALADLARQRPVSHIGLDTEFAWGRPGVVINAGKGLVAYDPRSIRPLVASLALAEPGPGGQEGGGLSPFVLDLRRPEVLPALAAVLRLPVPFVGHALKQDLFCLLRLQLPEPALLWDSWACSRCLYLGRHHRKYAARPGDDEAAEISSREQAEDDEEVRHSLLANCRRHGISHPHAADKGHLQQSFLSHPPDGPFSPEQIAYAAADAEAVARLYPHQLAAAGRAGILQHLTTVEMPWALTNARMAWRGVRVDLEKCRQVRGACVGHLDALRPRLREHGIGNVRSHPQLKAFFQRVGLLELFWRDGKLSFNKEALADFADRHATIPLIRAAKKVLQLQSDKLLTGELVGADGRVHPDHRQLGTDTGRQSCRWPNILGLGKVFRPLVVPDPGRGVGEADLSQIEVGLAGAVYGDDHLVAMFNTGDVYSAMAQHFYREQLPPQFRGLPSLAFKQHKEFAWMRARMKRCTLGILYGLTPHGLALYLGISRSEAAALQERFMAMFPALRQALADTASFGGLRGHVSTVSGLRRYRARRGQVSAWERNWMTNHPVQGSAAVVFKAAGNRLDRLYRAHGAWLIVPLHDAYVFEAPLAALEEVGAMTGRVLCESVQEYFPQLRPRAEVNVNQPHCWNKDGQADSLDHWMKDPTFALD
jgi:DNA polymerase-1